MSFYNYRGFVAVSSGISNGRSLHQELTKGRVTITGVDCKGRKFKRTAIITDGEVADNRHHIDGKLVHRISYGQFESNLTKSGREVTRFNPNTGTGKHGKSHKFEKFLNEPGCCHSWYKLGRLVRQKFIFRNGKLSYDWKGRSAPLEIRNHHGVTVYRITGMVDGSQFWGGDCLFSRSMDNWFRSNVPFTVEKFGKLWLAGKVENRQRVGKWVVDGKEVFYEHGVAIPRKLYETPPDKLDPRKLLNLPNAQLRMALLGKAQFSGKRLAELGRVVHRQGNMRLFDVPGLDNRILQVTCPSTKSLYFIKVPADSEKCEQARQWTFHVGAGVSAPIKFAQET